MNTRLTTGLALSVAAALTLAACGGGDAAEEPAAGGGEEGTDAPSVAHVINGSLGDQGFFDDAARGMSMLEEDGSRIQNIQADAENPAQWRSNLESVSGNDWDVVIVGTSQMVDILNETAPKYPDQSYIIYDSVVEQPNVASILYKQNEGSYLAGVLAALVTTDPETFPLANEEKVVGLVGGMDIPIINDFLAGFEKGVEAVDPEIEVLVSYVGDFADANRGFDQTKAMYDQGADVVFQVAGGAGIGVHTAAAEFGKYSIGVDANQNPLQEGHILASMLKNIGVSLDSAVKAYAAGELEFGKVAEYGLANDGVSLTFEDNGDIVPQEIQDLIKDYAQKVIDGEIEVPTTM
ncbi:ABC transporter substrate-binding protein [Actinotalea ferrariae CF5-4]|uniref:ABC transporter substrate-binding protein n=1 Tax=Actinotalea ferrariae CF5-4 TaxID=948458 RepID=A0A021VYG1_9CELL|nr:BMP family ABC transporter substrate-binding protein [Actinotalea ferrariae]EYR65045.1 ABC transporter substrate-binding protein [Actinotalea ferrariae CF5-4]